MMFIRKKKVLKMIDALIEDAEYFREHPLTDAVGGKERVAHFIGESQGLDRLKCWIGGYEPIVLKSRTRKKKVT